MLAYDIHALGEGTDSQGAVTVVLAPPDATGARGTGEYKGEARAENIIAASVEAYLEALNAMLAEAHWQGAPEAAAARAKKPTKVTESAARSGRAELDEAAGEIDTVDWFNQ